MAGAVALTARGVRKLYGDVVALEALDVTLREGEFLALLGPTGCGKSTFLNLVAGFEEASGGTIEVSGRPVTAPGPDREMVFQEHGLFPWLTVRQNIALGPKIRGESRRSRNARADEFISLVGLDGFGDHFPHQLSGGMRQRVSLARTLINEPKVLLMDEPFAALDAITRTEMQEFLLSIWSMTGATIVFVTHDVDEALLLADRVFVMSPRPGRLVKELDVSLERPRPHDIVTSAPFIELKKVLRNCLETAISERKAIANAR